MLVRSRILHSCQWLTVCVLSSGNEDIQACRRSFNPFSHMLGHWLMLEVLAQHFVCACLLPPKQHVPGACCACFRESTLPGWVMAMELLHWMQPVARLESHELQRRPAVTRHMVTLTIWRCGLSPALLLLQHMHARNCTNLRAHYCSSSALQGFRMQS